VTYAGWRFSSRAIAISLCSAVACLILSKRRSVACVNMAGVVCDNSSRGASNVWRQPGELWCAIRLSRNGGINNGINIKQRSALSWRIKHHGVSHWRDKRQRRSGVRHKSNIIIYQRSAYQAAISCKQQHQPSWRETSWRRKANAQWRGINGGGVGGSKRGDINIKNGVIAVRK